MNLEKPLMTTAWLVVIAIGLVIVLWLWMPLLLVFAALGAAAVILASLCYILSRNSGKEARR
jgi:hypothetical protein